MPRTTILAVAMLTLAVFSAGVAARDTSVKVLLDRQHWFCHTDPTGWPLADFKAVCSMIEPGGKGEVVEFIVDRKDKVRRKPAGQLKRETRDALRGAVA